MKHIALSSIDFDSATQLRAEINSQTVSDYAERMKDGDKFPPVDLFEVGDHYLIGDGWHRLLASQKNGDVTIPAEIHTGGKTAAIRFALGANAKHGMARTNADKRKAVEVALREFGNLSDRAIAELCGVSDPFVGKLRPQLQTVSSSPETRIGADGKERRLPTPKPKEAANPEPYFAPADADAGDEEETEATSAPKAPSYRPSNGLQYARMAISQLEKIQKNDKEKAAALELVSNWIKERL